MNLATALRVLSPCRTLAGASGTALQNKIVDELETGSVCFVIDQIAWYWLDKTSTETPSSPDVVATVRGSGSPGRWFKLEGGAGGGIEVLASNIDAGDLPFELPTSGAFGVPTDLEVTFGASVIGDQFDINVWVEIQNEDGNAHEIEAQLLLDAVPILQTQLITAPAVQTILFPLKYVQTLIADDASLAFSAGFRCDGAGAQIIAGSISVTKIPA